MAPLSLVLVTPPVAEPVSLEQAKLHLRVDYPDDDTLILALITAAREYAEAYQQRKFFYQTWKRTLDFFPIWTGDTTVNPNDRASWMYFSQYWNAVRIDLPGGVQSVTGITYVDGNTGQTVTLDPLNYLVDLTSIPARLVPAEGMTWPTQQLYAPGSVVITFVAGSYGDGVDVNTIPLTTVQGILMLIDHWYNHRGAVSSGSAVEMPQGAKALLDCHKMESFGYR